MKKLFYCFVIAFAVASLASCGNSSSSKQNGTDSVSNEDVEDSVSARGDDEVFDAQTDSLSTEAQSKGFGRCLVSGCYCKEFEGRGQTCKNCGHAYRKHY